MAALGVLRSPDQTPAGLNHRWRGEDVRLRRPKRQGGKARAGPPSAGRWASLLLLDRMLRVPRSLSV